MIKQIVCILMTAMIGLSSAAQVDELQNFRKKVAAFIPYDRGKVDSLPREASRTEKFRKELDELFLLFVEHKHTNNLDSLKSKCKVKKGNSFYFDNHGYSFNERYRDITLRRAPNNIDYHIGFYGIYDYRLPNFAGMYIQPFRVKGRQYIVYSYSLNGKGYYFIKDSASNKVMYKGDCITSELPIRAFRMIDERHFLVVEDMGDWGQRAMVLVKTAKGLEPIQAFRGKAFAEGSTEFRQKVFAEKRRYLWLASNRTLNTQYGSGKISLGLDEKESILFYQRVKSKTDKEMIRVEAKWKKNLFEVDDYYLGEHLDDSPVPMAF